MWLLHNNKVVPSTIVLSHIEQRERLLEACPEAVPHALVAGDICFDRLRASLPLRASYRRAFGVQGHQKLVVISSTWGPDSLVATHPGLPQRLAETLPIDEFRLMMALHPNIRSHHSRWQVSEYLAACERSGIYVPSDIDEWRAGIVAADLTVGDHGSVGFYSTALGNPLILAAAPDHTVDPHSPIAGLMNLAPRLDTTADLAEQMRRTIAEHDPRRYAQITALTTSEADRSPAILRAAMYRTLGLSEPSEPAEISAVPLPSGRIVGPHSHLVHVKLGTVGTAAVTRFPAERLRTDTATPRGAHLAIGVRDPRRQWLEIADVMVGATGEDTEQWIVDTLTQLPGCALATAPISRDSWLLGTRAGDLLRIEGTPSACRLFASVAYQWLLPGRASATLAGPWRIGCAGREHSIVSRVARAP